MKTARLTFGSLLLVVALGPFDSVSAQWRITQVIAIPPQAVLPAAHSGQQAPVLVSFGVRADGGGGFPLYTHCGFSMNFGDGRTASYKAEAGTTTMVQGIPYMRPGTYQIHTVGIPNLEPGMPSCGPGPQIVLTVSAAAQSAPAVSQPVPAADPCPSGWALVPGSRSGNAFSCAKRPLVSCPAGTQYFDDGRTLGCK